MKCPTAHRIFAILALTASIGLTMTGCGFQGLNSVSLPGAVGRGSSAQVYHAQLANIGTLERNSPVMLDDVVVGNVGAMTFDNWHINVDFSVQPGVTIPANAAVSVGQTSLLGSMHLALDPPAGEVPQGSLPPGSTLQMNRTSTYPSTEQTLMALSSVVNGGQLGQIGDIVHSMNEVFAGHQDKIRDLIARLNNLVGVLDDQRDNMVETVRSLNRLAGTLAAQNDVISDALAKIPPALDVLTRERPRLTTALDKLRVFSDTSTHVLNESKDDLIKNLQNLAPTFRALSDVGPYLDIALAAATTFPQAQDTIDRGIKGDYMNLFGVIDLTVPRLKRTMMLGTRWGDNSAPLVPAPGEPFGAIYTTDPLSISVAPPDPAPAAPPPAGSPATGEPVPSQAAPPALTGPSTTPGAPEDPAVPAQGGG
jgi:virulence factor Mce-like protein